MGGGQKSWPAPERRNKAACSQSESASRSNAPSSCRGRSYRCHLDSKGHAYTPDQIDFIAAYIIPTDTWYILPIRSTNAQTRHPPDPAQHASKYEKYKEAWHLLQR